MSSSPAVRDAVQQADLLLDIGGMVTIEINTGLWSAVLHPERIISIQDNWVRAGDKVFLNVAIDDVLAALIAKVPTRTASIPQRVDQTPRLLAREATSCLPPPSIPVSSAACVTVTPSSSKRVPA
jgi:TPP-dependent 2-oxoacid decarboxylase